MKLFDHISEIAEDTSSLVCVLIDEIESIASARNASIRSNEPSDAVRSPSLSLLLLLNNP
jgi:pachytene checkpoint protein 2